MTARCGATVFSRASGLPVIVGRSCPGRDAVTGAGEWFFTRADSDSDLA